MILYHGTNIDFASIDLKKCKPNKDFGQGFYLTDIQKQAKQMAVRRCDFEQCGAPVIQKYEFDERLLSSNELNVKRFEKVSKEWAEFIFKNRNSRGKFRHNYDIVYGPIADDGVVYQLTLFEQHIISIDQLVEGLTFRKLNNQYYFGTELAISKLHRL
jgi:hypothetical protein